MFFLTVYATITLAAINNASEQDALTADQAFTLNALLLDANTLQLNWNIAPKALLYKKKNSFSLQNLNPLYPHPAIEILSRARWQPIE